MSSSFKQHMQAIRRDIETLARTFHVTTIDILAEHIIFPRAEITALEMRGGRVNGRCQQPGWSGLDLAEPRFLATPNVHDFEDERSRNGSVVEGANLSQKDIQGYVKSIDASSTTGEEGKKTTAPSRARMG